LHASEKYRQTEPKLGVYLLCSTRRQAWQFDKGAQGIAGKLRYGCAIAFSFGDQAEHLYFQKDCRRCRWILYAGDKQNSWSPENCLDFLQFTVVVRVSIGGALFVGVETAVVD